MAAAPPVCRHGLEECIEYAAGAAARSSCTMRGYERVSGRGWEFDAQCCSASLFCRHSNRASRSNRAPTAKAAGHPTHKSVERIQNARTSKQIFLALTNSFAIILQK